VQRVDAPLHMLEVQTVRELIVAGPEGPPHLSAASGLVQVGGRAFVVADDENHLGVFDLSNSEPGRLIRLFDEELPLPHKARKAAKADCEALLVLPAFGHYPCGALMAMGSGSRRSRQRAALVALAASGEPQGPTRTIDLAPLLEPLRDLIPDLNVEGAFLQGETLCLLQRGNGRPAINARIDLSWRHVQAWLAAAGPAPRPTSITPFSLGAIDGVPLTFTDGAALPGGDWLFSAAAEDTSDTYLDGFCAGSAIGIVDSGGTVRTLKQLSLTCKVEGIAASATVHSIDLLLVTDADDRSQPALLLSASMPRCTFNTTHRPTASPPAPHTASPPATPARDESFGAAPAARRRAR